MFCFLTGDFCYITGETSFEELYFNSLCFKAQKMPETQVNEMHALYDNDHKVSSILKSHQNTRNSVKCEVI